MSPTAVRPPTLEELARAGEDALRARDQQRRQQEEEEFRRRDSWDALRAAVARETPVLLPFVTADLPDAWPVHAPYEYTLHLRPFGGATLKVDFQSHDDGARWTLFRRVLRGGRDLVCFTAPVSYEARRESSYGDAYCALPTEDFTADLGEALALCRRAEPLLAACLAECARRTAAVREATLARAAQAKPPSAGERLLAALACFVAEREPEPEEDGRDE
jgi:hypothetical protein